MNSGGILIRLEKKGNSEDQNLPREICDKIKELIALGNLCYIFEISDDDIRKDLSTKYPEIERIDYFVEDLGFRIGFYIKTGNFFSSVDKSNSDSAKEELIKIGKMMDSMGLSSTQRFPIIVHIGSAQGSRKKIMSEFCDFYDGLPENVKKRLCVINDEKPSLFSVKDLLPGINSHKKIPIVFRSTSFPTNRGSLTYKESIFLSASSWPEEVTPIIIYLPYMNIITKDEINPYGMDLDIVLDNSLPGS